MFYKRTNELMNEYVDQHIPFNIADLTVATTEYFLTIFLSPLLKRMIVRGASVLRCCGGSSPGQSTFARAFILVVDI